MKITVKAMKTVEISSSENVWLIFQYLCALKAIHGTYLTGLKVTI